MQTVNEIIHKLKKGELEDPNTLSEYLVVLSANLNVAGNFELDAEVNYAAKWEEIKLSSEDLTDKLTDAKAKQTPEYKEWQRMKIANRTVLECIRALKKRLQNLSDELKSGQNY